MIIYLGIGTNLGNREENLNEALRLLCERVGKQLACSKVYYSAPQDFVSDNEFANIVALYHTAHSLEDVLDITQIIEREMGRVQKSVNGVHYDRVIDIDLLKAYAILAKENGQWTIGEELSVSTAELVLPHPKMHERDFVMVPLKEIETNYIPNTFIL